MRDDIENSAARLGQFSETARDIQRTLEQALGWIRDAEADLAALECHAAHEALGLSQRAHDDISNVAYGWGRDIDNRAAELARHVRS